MRPCVLSASCHWAFARQARPSFLRDRPATCEAPLKSLLLHPAVVLGLPSLDPAVFPQQCSARCPHRRTEPSFAYAWRTGLAGTSHISPASARKESKGRGIKRVLIYLPGLCSPEAGRKSTPQGQWGDTGQDGLCGGPDAHAPQAGWHLGTEGSVGNSSHHVPVGSGSEQSEQPAPTTTTEREKHALCFLRQWIFTSGTVLITCLPPREF